LAAGNTAMVVESYVNLDIGRKAQTRDSDSSDKVAVQFAERNSSSAGAIDYNCTWAAPVADSAEDLCISAIGRTVRDCHDN
jgi:hypothetical protein